LSWENDDKTYPGGFGHTPTLRKACFDCQAIILHLVFKTRKEELDQLKSGLESLSLRNFLRVSEGCFTLQSEAMVTKDDFLKVIDQSVESLWRVMRKKLMIGLCSMLMK